RTMLVDTGRMRVNGTGDIDYVAQTLRLRMEPKAKRPEFLSLATPIEVNGGFTDFRVEVSTLDVIGTVGRMASSIVTAPVARLFGDEELPEDGRDACAAPDLTGLK
ncbi:MAG: hypothetical protein OEW21_00975, partial [Betaproteobacteria bacterium]|nr:hypothetical protein [Betaproteobacteria bacterium]